MRACPRSHVSPAAEPPKRALLVIGYADVFDAADAVPLVLNHGVIGLKGVETASRDTSYGAAPSDGAKAQALMQ